jgi:hypothetical protein
MYSFIEARPFDTQNFGIILPMWTSSEIGPQPPVEIDWI